MPHEQRPTHAPTGTTITVRAIGSTPTVAASVASTLAQPAPVQASTNPLVVFLSKYPSEHSRRAMRVSLDACAKALLGREDATALDVPWQTLRYAHVQALRARLAGDYAPSSANRHLVAVRGVLKECWRLGMIPEVEYRKAIDVDPVKGQRLPAGRALADTEVKALFLAALRRGGAQGKRDAVLLILTYGCGLRRGEVAGLPLEAYRPEENAIAVLGKGRKERLVYLPPNGNSHFYAWIAVRGDAPGPLVCPVDRYGHPNLRRGLSEDSIYGVLADLAEKAGVRDFSPHDLRRTFITMLLDAEIDVLTVRDLAGHADVQTTARYDRRGEKRKASAVTTLAVPTLDVPSRGTPTPKKGG